MNLKDGLMSEDKIRYDILASEALRGIIRTVLMRVQKRGLPGEHHFFINFDTRAPGVVISKRLLAQYPEEMIIVLQHKFWDLAVYDDRFEIMLSFSGVPERLVIPFASIKSFMDPSVQFGFNPNVFITGQAPSHAASPMEEPSSIDRPALPRPHILADQALASTDLEVEVDVEEVVQQEEQPTKESAKIVELDLFRKK